MDKKQTEILEAITFFEQMLQTMPDDRVSLEFLGGAYEQVGDRAKALSAWMRLADEILQAADVEQARAVRPRLTAYLDDPELAMKAARIESLIGVSVAPHAAASEPARSAPTAADISLKPAQLRMSAAFEEVNLAWLLHERGFLNAAEYEQLTVEMTEGGAEVPELPVSSLLGLHQLHPDKTEAALALLAGLHLLAPLRLDLFEIPEDVKTLLPVLYVRIRGAFPFARQGHSLLVALLNPADAKLKEEVEALAGMPCTFFLAHPAHLEGVLTAAYPVPAAHA